jgi:hypothetical protein
MPELTAQVARALSPKQRDIKARYYSIYIIESPHTPTGPKRYKFDTPHRARFFKAYDQRKKDESFNLIYRQKDIYIPPSTARRWLRERDLLGSPAYRRTRKVSKRLGRPYIISESQLRAILFPFHRLYGLRYPTIVKNESFSISTRGL